MEPSLPSSSTQLPGFGPLPPLAWAAALTSHWSSGTRLCTLRDLSEACLLSGIPLIKILSPLATRGRGHLIRGGVCAHTGAFKTSKLTSCSQSCWFRRGPEAGTKGVGKGATHTAGPCKYLRLQGWEGQAGHREGLQCLWLRRGRPTAHPTGGTIQKGVHLGPLKIDQN